MADLKIKVGDVVVAAPEYETPMTVELVDGQTVGCAWFEGSKYAGWTFKRGRFLAEGLVVKTVGD